MIPLDEQTRLSILGLQALIAECEWTGDVAGKRGYEKVLERIELKAPNESAILSTLFEIGGGLRPEGEQVVFMQVIGTERINERWP